MIIMLVSIGTRAGFPNVFQSGIMSFFFKLMVAGSFFGAMINAIFTWRHEKREQTEKEITRIKESLTTEGRNIIEQVEKAKLAFLRNAVKETCKTFDKSEKEFTARANNEKNWKDAAAKLRRELQQHSLAERRKLVDALWRRASTLLGSAESLALAANNRLALRRGFEAEPSIEESSANPQSEPVETSNYDSLESRSEQNVCWFSVSVNSSFAVCIAQGVCNLSADPTGRRHPAHLRQSYFRRLIVCVNAFYCCDPADGPLVECTIAGIHWSIAQAGNQIFQRPSGRILHVQQVQTVRFATVMNLDNIGVVQV